MVLTKLFKFALPKLRVIGWIPLKLGLLLCWRTVSPSWDAAWFEWNCSFLDCNLNAASSLVQVERKRKDKQQSANTVMSIKLSLFSSSNEEKRQISTPPEKTTSQTKGHCGLWGSAWKLQTVYVQPITQPSIPLGTGGIQMITQSRVRTYRSYKQKGKVQCKVCITTNTNKKTSREEQMGWLRESEIFGETNSSRWRDWSRRDGTDSAGRTENLLSSAERRSKNTYLQAISKMDKCS